MDKHSAIMGISIVLNRGLKSEQDTVCFENIPHDDLIQDIRAYLLLHENILGDMHIETSQALNDHGVDLILTLNQTCKVGFQVKSHFDVSEKDFAAKVKRQYSESLAHGLDKWYLLICAPLKTSSDDYSGRINHLINELSMFKSNYHCVFGPQYTAGIYKNCELMSPEEFNSSLQRYSYTQIDIEVVKALLANLNVSSKDRTESFVSRVVSNKVIMPQTCNKLNIVLDWRNSEEELKVTKQDFLELLDILQSIPLNTRKLLSIALEKSIIIRRDELQALIFEIRTTCNIADGVFYNHFKLLEKYKLMELDNDDSDYVFINNGGIEWPIMRDIKFFAGKQKIPLDKIIVDLNFSLFD